MIQRITDREGKKRRKLARLREFTEGGREGISTYEREEEMKD